MQMCLYKALITTMELTIPFTVLILSIAFTNGELIFNLLVEQSGMPVCFMARFIVRPNTKPFLQSRMKIAKSYLKSHGRLYL